MAFDKDAGGLATIAGALASLVAVFVYGRRKDAEERRQKREDFAGFAGPHNDDRGTLADERDDRRT